MDSLNKLYESIIIERDVPDDLIDLIIDTYLIALDEKYVDEMTEEQLRSKTKIFGKWLKNIKNKIGEHPDFERRRALYKKDYIEHYKNKK